MNKQMIIFSFVTLIIGFMVAVQFKTTNDPEIRDTRSLLELRHELTLEKEKQKELNDVLVNQKALLYQLQETEDVEDVMLEAIWELRERAGLTEISGQGIVLEIYPFFDENYMGGPIRSVPPYLLRMLINELNINGAAEIAIDNQRIISTTPIREVNGVTLINSKRVTQFPLEIKVITDNPEKLHHAIMSSLSKEYFSYENLLVESTPINYIELPAYDKTIQVNHMSLIKEGS